ncbi:hypothetical protein KKF34_00920 [Myxococcota bacterium]|nr:hypothetical protein [Myxococcota bacterium]MBU1381044.1 hypothetical protein [Myxococcota bacterium]MBU1495423.1 hypothetical protein [Myxococcota bacterium]
MILVLVLKIITAVIIVFFLRPHVAAVIQTLLPSTVRHRFIDEPMPPLFQEFIDRGYTFVGIRQEKIPLIFSRKYAVFHNKDGYFTDIPIGSLKGIYIISWIPETIFLMTRNTGMGNISSGIYHSFKVSSGIIRMEKEHLSQLAKLSMGDLPEVKSDRNTRLEAARFWYSSCARGEMWKFAVLSGIITLIGIALIVRIFLIK